MSGRIKSHFLNTRTEFSFQDFQDGPDGQLGALFFRAKLI
jgi:hypothetical protein